MAIQITGSWNITGSFTASLGFQGTASYATTASYALTGGSINTGSFLTTASVSSNTITFTKGNGTTFPITVATGSGGGGGNTSALVGNTDVVMAPYLGPLANTFTLSSSSVSNYYATSSGTHVLIANTDFPISCSFNIRFDTSTISDGQYVYVIPYMLGGTGVAVRYRTIISNPGGLLMYNASGIPSGIGTTDSTINRTSGGPKYSAAGTALNPTVMLRISGSILFNATPSNNYSTIIGPFSGSSYGTPL